MLNVPIKDRAIDVGYRTRRPPLARTVGYEKWYIGAEFSSRSKICLISILTKKGSVCMENRGSIF